MNKREKVFLKTNGRCAYCVTKFLNYESEIEDYFIKKGE